MLGQFVDDFDARQIRRQRLALATTFGGCDDLFFYIFVGNVGNVGDAFCVIEKGKLGRSRISCLLGLAPEQALAQERVSSSRKPTRDCIFVSICLSS